MPQFSGHLRIILEGNFTVEAASPEAVKAMAAFDFIRPDDEFFIRAELVDYRITAVKRLPTPGD